MGRWRDAVGAGPPRTRHTRRSIAKLPRQRARYHGARPDARSRMSSATDPLRPPPGTPADAAARTADDPQAADARLAGLQRWLQDVGPRFGVDPESLRPASNDASFRRYFRVDTDAAASIDSPVGDAAARGAPTLIAVDAPPQHEDSAAFVRVAAILRDAGVTVPTIHAADLARGYLLVGDLGTTTYLEALRSGAAPRPLYEDALAALVRLQAASRPGLLPDYDRERLRTELLLFPEWFVERHLGAALTATERTDLERVAADLLASHLAQPRVIVHRDYHCRNLMRLASGNPGILDFQGALFGPIAYDVVSLLRDAYVDIDEAQQIDYAARYWDMARRAALPVAADFGVFWRDLEWMGLQRHLKILGIFSRLAHRDGKRGYLGDLPRVADAALAVARRYDALAPLGRLLIRLRERLDDAGCAR